MMAKKAEAWMPLDRWHALVAGEECPMCEAIGVEEPIDRYGYTIADMRISRLRLARNQYVSGYCVLICRKHVREPYFLAPHEQTAFFQDLMQAAKALDMVYHPDKMNLQILGNLVPHLHVHLTPRYHGDPAPGRPIDPNGGMRTMRARTFEERAKLIRKAL
jgi:diadenosine tetraphosphate (Ap4A) HIT family hydrolase